MIPVLKLEVNTEGRSDSKKLSIQLDQVVKALVMTGFQHQSGFQKFPTLFNLTQRVKRNGGVVEEVGQDLQDPVAIAPDLGISVV